MSFIETLKSVGGVKPCDEICKVATCPKWNRESDEHCSAQGLDDKIDTRCSRLILDLAPLMAKPEELRKCVYDLRQAPEFGETKLEQNLYIVGPQRASNLVYEVARQLGGTAVVANNYEEKSEILPIQSCPLCGQLASTGGCPPSHVYCANKSCAMYGSGVLPVAKWNRIVLKTEELHLTFPIPPDATVLFVTDRMDAAEMSSIMDVTMASAPERKPHQFLTYVLALVSHMTEWVFPDPENTAWPIISLHREKS